MRIRVLFLLLIIFAVGVMVGVILFSSRIPDLPSQPEVTVKVEEEGAETVESHGVDIEEPDIIAEDIELLQGAQGRIDWRVQAKTAKYSQEQGKVVVSLPQLTAFIGEEREEVFIRADLGEVDQEGDNLRLWDNVIGRYGMFALRADSFDYIGAMNRVYLKGNVGVERPDISVNATALEIDVNSRELVAGGGVEALITPEGLSEVLDQ